MLKHLYAPLIFVFVCALTIYIFFYFRIVSPAALLVYAVAVVCISVKIQSTRPFSKYVVDIAYYFVGCILVVLTPYLATSELEEFRYGSQAKLIDVALEETQSKITFFKDSTPPENYEELTNEQLNELATLARTKQSIQKSANIFLGKIMKGDENWYVNALVEVLNDDASTDDSKYSIPNGM